jgi:8-oxo-dGTP diphosphatase
VLIARRPEGKALGGLWEFPGGKLELGESPEQAVVRELREELAVIIRIEDLCLVSFASHAYPDFHLLMPLFACCQWDGAPQALEHQEIAWVSVPDLAREHSAYPMPPADAPLLPSLAAFVGTRSHSR